MSDKIDLSTAPDTVAGSSAMSRRQIFKLAAAGAAVVAAPTALQRSGAFGGGASGLARQDVIGGTIVGDYQGTTPKVTPFTVDLPRPPVLAPTSTANGVDTYDMTMRQARVEILPGLQTTIWGYNGITPGPTIDQRAGRPSVVRMKNALPEKQSVHLHGSPTLPQFDGHPEILIPPGGQLNYEYPNTMSARMLWYHDHAMHITSRHVYQGLAGLYLLRSASEDALGLPSGEFEVPLVIQDKMFAADGSLVYDDHGHSDLMGDITLVNGAPWPRMQVQARKYRFRVLLGSNSRGYRLKLSNNMPMTMIGTDAGLMAGPVNVTELLIGMAERYEFVLDFSTVPAGTKVTMLNTREDGAMANVMRFDVVRATTPDTSRVPAVLDPSYKPIAIPAGAVQRSFRFDRSGGMWTINGKIWETGRVDANPKLGTTEVWTLSNNSGGWFHPVHIHLVDFQILDRNGRPPYAFERGWKDVAYVGEGETVRVAMKFGPHKGRYVMHCHNVVHEDHDMMNQFEVT